MQSPLSPPIEAGQRALALRIDAALPQTQCRRCGYPDCAGYAAAVAADASSIDRCPPGGIEGIARLAELTGRARVPLDPVCGEEAPRQLAVVDEAWCIGCTLCIQACPTDAIIGAPKAMHTVVESRCTGCALCLPVCPVDCIALENASGNRTGWNAWSAAQAEKAREDYRQRTARLQRDAHIGRLQRDRDAQAVLADLTAHSSIADEVVLARKREAIEAALARARTRAASTAATK